MSNLQILKGVEKNDSHSRHHRRSGIIQEDNQPPSGRGIGLDDQHQRLRNRLRDSNDFWILAHRVCLEDQIAIYEQLPPFCGDD
jgi:hypothetical protein